MSSMGSVCLTVIPLLCMTCTAGHGFTAAGHHSWRLELIKERGRAWQSLDLTAFQMTLSPRIIREVVLTNPEMITSFSVDNMPTIRLGRCLAADVSALVRHYFLLMYMLQDALPPSTTDLLVMGVL